MKTLLFYITLLVSSTAYASDESHLEKLRGSIWQWVRFQDPLHAFELNHPEQYTITFADHGKASIKADCNRAQATYEATEERSISIQVGPTTRVACPPESRGNEFLKKLGYVAGFFFKNHHLFMDMMADGGTFEFKPSGLPQNREIGPLP